MFSDSDLPASKWSAKAEIARSMALLPVCDSEGRARCAARLAHVAETGDSDDVLNRSGVVVAATYLARASLRLREGRLLLDALAVRAFEAPSAYSPSLRHALNRSFLSDRALSIELACESVSTPARRFMEQATAHGRHPKDTTAECHPDILIRKLLHADDSGTTLRYTALEVDAVFFRANEVDTEVVHSLWSSPPVPKSGSGRVATSPDSVQGVARDEVHLADEDYYVSLERPSIASRIADATATDVSFARRIAAQPGGLRALRHLAESAPQGGRNDLFVTDIARSIANIAAGTTDISATATQAVDDGLVSLLSKWSDADSKHVASGHLRVESFRALSNLSQSLVTVEGERCKFVNGLLPLQAPSLDGATALPSARINTDIVFVHGLRGGPLRTWRCGQSRATDSLGNLPEGKETAAKANLQSSSETGVWPRDWLTEDARNCRVVSVGHDAGVLRGGLSPGMIGPTLEKRAEDIRLALRDARIGAEGRRIVFVSHSYGGLLVKELLLKDENLMKRTRGVVFFGVPHFGSPVAGSWSGQSQVVLSQAVRELFPDADARAALERLNQDFFESVEACAGDRSRIRVVSFGEGQKLKVGARGQASLLLDLVPRMSADPQYGQFWLIHDADHVQLSKPRRREDFRYRVVVGIARGEGDDAHG